MDISLDRQLARFLRQQRGEMTFIQFSRKIGLPPSAIFRLENGRQSITLSQLQGVLQRLKTPTREVFES